MIRLLVAATAKSSLSNEGISAYSKHFKRAGGDKSGRGDFKGYWALRVHWHRVYVARLSRHLLPVGHLPIIRVG